VDSVVEQGDRVAEDAADNFGADETECGSHSPAEDAGAEGRVLVAMVAMAVTVAVRMAVGMSGGRGGSRRAIVAVVAVGVIV
jgi:hypothetical protein